MTTPVAITRHTARILLIDAQSRLLLFRWQLQDGNAVWFTPGGGLQAGETHEEAAIRELWEETGIECTDLGACVWHRDHTYTWDGQSRRNQERFYVVRCEAPAISHANFTELEQRFMAEHRWWTVDDIAASESRFAPRNLAALLPPILAGEYPSEPLLVVDPPAFYPGGAAAGRV